MDYLIWEKKNLLSDNICDVIIDRFEKDSNKIKGRIGSGNHEGSTYDPTVKQSLDLHLINNPENWFDVQEVLNTKLQEGIQEYFTHLSDLDFPAGFSKDQDIKDSGFQIQKTDPNGFYKWHNDFFLVDNYARILTYIFYLNDVEEGGETEFISGEKIKPEKGKLLIFPASWTYVHRGNSPINTSKYICTGWMYFQY